MAGNGIYFNESKPKGSLDREIVFLCEGKDDAYFLDTVAENLGISADRLGITFVEGSTNFCENVIALSKTSAFVTGDVKTIVVFHDCDGSNSTSAELINCLIRNGFPKLSHSEIVRTEWRGFERQFGYFEIGIAGEGALEDLILSSCQHESRYIRATTALADQELETGELDHRSKRVSQIYLSLYPTHWRGVGRALKAGVFDNSHNAFDQVREFIRQLF